MFDLRISGSCFTAVGWGEWEASGISPGLCRRKPGSSGKELVLVVFFLSPEDYAIKIISLVLLIGRSYYLTYKKNCGHCA